MITTQKELRAAFWRDHRHLSRRLIPDYSGQGLMHCTDTRVAWSDWLDSMQRGGQISEGLDDRATLQPTPRTFEFQVQGYFGVHGWECVTAEPERSEARARLQEYRANDPQHAYRMRRCVAKG